MLIIDDAEFECAVHLFEPSNLGQFAQLHFVVTAYSNNNNIYIIYIYIYIIIYYVYVYVQGRCETTLIGGCIIESPEYAIFIKLPGFYWMC